MTEIIMFNDNLYSRERYAWRRALQACRVQWTGNAKDNWYDDLRDEYGIVPVIIENGIAGVEIVDQEKFMLFRIRYL
jgi:hypothetical protein